MKLSTNQPNQPHSWDAETIGLVYGFLGVLSFSLTLPATRVAVTGLPPTFVGLGRAVVAGVLAMLLLWFTRQPLPSRQQWYSLAIVALGVILGFPLLSAWAMQRLPASHGAVVIGLLPLATAVVATIRTKERPSWPFWLAGIIGSATIVGFTLQSSTASLMQADLLLVGSVVAAAIGYAEGGYLARSLGGWQVICWALVLSTPILILPTLHAAVQHGLTTDFLPWLGFGYVSVISQFLGFFAWYHGMRVGGVARVSQLQLLQPFLTIVFSAFLLGEQITGLMIIAACIVISCVALGRKALIDR